MRTKKSPSPSACTISREASDRLVGEHRHLPLPSIGRHPIRLSQARQRLRDTLIDRGVVELVDAVVAQKILQSRTEQDLVLRILESAAHQRGSAVSDIARNDVTVQFGAADMPHRRIHGVNQIQARVDQGAIQIKHQQADAMRIEGAQEDES